MCASGFDHAVGENENAVGHANTGKTMRDQDGRFAVTEFLEALEYFKLGACVQRRRRFVEDQHGRFAHIGAGDRDFLPFPTGKLDTVLEPFADHLLIASWQSADHLVGLAAPRRAYDAGVVAAGGNFSHGDIIARAYMREAAVLVLDEPTAALDARSEFEVFKRFKELSDGKTAVLISHRFSSVRMADRILVLADGMVEAAGTHDELMAQPGRYSELFELQAAGYR